MDGAQQRLVLEIPRLGDERGHRSVLLSVLCALHLAEDVLGRLSTVRHEKLIMNSPDHEHHCAARAELDGAALRGQTVLLVRPFLDAHGHRHAEAHSRLRARKLRARVLEMGVRVCCCCSVCRLCVSIIRMRQSTRDGTHK